MGMYCFNFLANDIPSDHPWFGNYWSNPSFKNFHRTYFSEKDVVGVQAKNRLASRTIRYQPISGEVILREFKICQGNAMLLHYSSFTLNSICAPFLHSFQCKNTLLLVI